jgi:hypothetical protein
MVGTITHKTQGTAKERLKDAQPTKTKEGRELVPFMVGSYFTHNPSNVANMQIVRSNINRMFKTCISYQCNLPLYNIC